MKKTIIKAFLKRYNRDSGEIKMPPHLWHRWYGIDGRFYNAVWKSIGADKDDFIFDDFCDISFDVKNENYDSLKKLHGSRLNRLYAFSWMMLVHYLMVTIFWKITEISIKLVYNATH